MKGNLLLSKEIAGSGSAWASEKSRALLSIVTDKILFLSNSLSEQKTEEQKVLAAEDKTDVVRTGGGAHFLPGGALWRWNKFRPLPLCDPCVSSTGALGTHERCCTSW